jgi:hypothetical protein
MCHFHDRNQALVPILSKFRAVHTFTVIFSQINLLLFSFYYYFSHGVRLSPVSTAATACPIVLSPDGMMMMTMMMIVEQ